MRVKQLLVTTVLTLTLVGCGSSQTIAEEEPVEIQQVEQSIVVEPDQLSDYVEEPPAIDNTVSVEVSDSIGIIGPAEEMEESEEDPPLNEEVVEEVVEEPVMEEPVMEEPIAEPTPEPEPQEVKTLYGPCTITYYCNCTQCCGQWAGGATASGAMPQSGVTVAADLPFGTEIEINGERYTVQDRGVSGMWIDVYCSSHDEALARGMYTADVYIIAYE